MGKSALGEARDKERNSSKKPKKRRADAPSDDVPAEALISADGIAAASALSPPEAPLETPQAAAGSSRQP